MIVITFENVKIKLFDHSPIRIALISTNIHVLMKSCPAVIFKLARKRFTISNDS